MTYTTVFVRQRILLWILCTCWLVGALGLMASPALSEDTTVAEDEIAAWGFPVGEELVYKAYWGAIPVGEAVVSSHWEEGSEGELLLLRLRVRSNRAIAAVYPVRIDVESLIRVSDFLPLRHSQNRREGRRRTEEETVFDYERGVAVWRNARKKREDVIALEPETRDILTFLYYLRRFPFALDSRTHYRVLTDEKIYDLWLNVSKEEEQLKGILDDRIPVVEIEPEAAFDGVFRRQGRLHIHVSRDPRQLMLRMRANIPVGSVRMVLSEVRGPGEDVWRTEDE